MSAHAYAATLLETRRSASRRNNKRRVSFLKVLRNSSLNEELQARGIEVIPYDMVKTYHREILEKRMATAGFFHRHWHLANIIKLGNELGIVVFLVGFLNLCALGKFSLVWPLLLSVGAAATFLGILRFLFWHKLDGTTGIYWKTEPVYYVSTVPEQFQDAVRNAQKIPGAKVCVQTFETDPFLLVKKRGWLTIQRAYIACWDCPGFTWKPNKKSRR